VTACPRGTWCECLSRDMAETSKRLLYWLLMGDSVPYKRLGLYGP
jgi:hypothetical protein